MSLQKHFKKISRLLVAKIGISMPSVNTLKIKISFSVLLAGLVFFGSELNAQAAVTIPVSSIVKIFVGFGDITKPQSTWDLALSGSGFVVDDKDNWIVTNAHVITQPGTYSSYPIYIVCTIDAAADSYDCSYTAKLLYADVSNDLGLIQVNGNVPDSTKKFFQPKIDLGTGRLPNAAETIYLAGFPSLGGKTITISQGIVSGYEKDSDGTISALKTDSNIVRGMSGGIAVDSLGAFLGIPSLYITNYSNDRVGYIIAASVVQSWMADMLKQNFSKGPIVFIPFPTIVEGVTVTKLSSTSARLSWPKPVSNSEIVKYQIMYSKSPLFNGGHIQQTHMETTTNQITINNLNLENTYYFSVLAFDKAGNHGEFWSKETIFSLKSVTNIFPDVSTSHHNYYAIRYLKEHGMVAGYLDGTFGPERTINRAEIVKIIIKGKGINPDPNIYKNCFLDVKEDKEEWFASAVCYAKEKGWVAGYKDGTYKPAQDVNLVESLKIMQKAYELPVDVLQLSTSVLSADYIKALPSIPVNLRNQWFSSTLSTMDVFGILDGQLAITNPAEKVSRAKTAEHIYRIIMLGKVNKDYKISGWSDSNGKPFDLIRYHGLNKTYQKFIDDKGEASETNITNKCSVATAYPCYTVTYSKDGVKINTEEIGLKNNLLKTLKVDDSPLDPETIELASFNTLNYFRFKTPIETKAANGSTMKIIDGVRSIQWENMQSIQTFAGKKSALVLSIKTVMNIESSTNGVVGNFTIKSEGLSYFVRDMGQVKTSLFVTVEKDGKILNETSMNVSMTEER